MKYRLPYVTVKHESGLVGQHEDDRQDALIEEYDRYFASIKSKLPPDLIQFVDRDNSTVSLNDGHLHSIDCDFETRVVGIVIDGHVYGPDRPKMGWGMLTLRYEQVSQIQYIGEDKKRLHVGVGDHLFDEIELIDDHTFKHSTYFAGDVEIAVTFGDFSLRYGSLEPVE